jgi:hypothetical protein
VFISALLTPLRSCRRLPLASPAALCLDAALTLAHALTLLRVPLPHARGAAELTVHLLGPRRELDQLPGARDSAKHAFVACALLSCALSHMSTPHAPPSFSSRSFF